MSIIKICGLSDTDAVSTASTSGATHLGFILYESSPRYISVSTAANLIESSSDCERVAVTVNADDKLLNDIVTTMRPTMLQLHGAESVERISQIKDNFALPIIKAIGISTKQDLDSISIYESHPSIDYILLDYKSANFGGSGKSFDWSLIESLHCQKPLILAGGVSLENITQAIDLIKDSNNDFCGIDVSSSLESTIGVKDSKLIEQFLRKVSSHADS